jgi:4-hydroxyphenylpyruvate dioxygenase
VQTGSRDVVTHVVRQNKILFAFSSPLNPGNKPVAGADMNEHLAKHGDGVKDVAFTVTDCRALHASAVKRGATSIAEPHEESDENGTVLMATVATYGDTHHTFVQRIDYRGPFLPGYRAVTKVDPLVKLTPPIGLDFIDHVVGNMPDGNMLTTVEWYERVLQVRRPRHCRCCMFPHSVVSHSFTASGAWTTSKSTRSTLHCGLW